MVINWTSPAIQDLKDFKKYTLKSNSKMYILGLVETVNFLTTSPKLGKIFFYFNKHIIRQLIYKELFEIIKKLSATTHLVFFVFSYFLWPMLI